MSDLIKEEQLLDWLGYSRSADVERKLRQHGIGFIFGKQGKICTTMEQLNKIIEIQGKINGP